MTVDLRREDRYGKKEIGSSRDFPSPKAEDGYVIWIENGTWCTAPKVDPKKFGLHTYFKPGAYDGGNRDCICGCHMLNSSSGGPCDPFGRCPENPLPEPVTITVPQALIEFAVKYPDTDWNEVVKYAVEANDGHVSMRGATVQSESTG